MAVHDWTRVSPGTFHDFHGRWMTHLTESLNAGLLPAGYYALSTSEAELTATKQRTLVIRHASGDRIVALLEIVSPGNKDRRFSLDRFVDKAVSALRQNYHLLIVDLFPPGAASRSDGDESLKALRRHDRASPLLYIVVCRAYHHVRHPTTSRYARFGKPAR